MLMNMRLSWTLGSQRFPLLLQCMLRMALDMGDRGCSRENHTLLFASPINIANNEVRNQLIEQRDPWTLVTRCASDAELATTELDR